MKLIISTLVPALLLSPLATLSVKAEDAYTACINKARNYGLTNHEIVIACQGATLQVAPCMDSAWSYGLRSHQIARVCRQASVDTAACLEAAWRNTLRSEQIVAVCRTITECDCNCPSDVRIYRDSPRPPVIIRPN